MQQSKHASPHQVNNRKHHHPDQIDHVPEGGSRLDTEGRRAAADQSKDQDAETDVQKVKAGQKKVQMNGLVSRPTPLAISLAYSASLIVTKAAPSPIASRSQWREDRG
jgi:hypothetical protein